MTYHDPLQGILTCRPKTVLRRTATSVRLQGGNPRRNDRLQGILFKAATPQAPGRTLPTVLPGTVIAATPTDQASRSSTATQASGSLDDLTLDEFDEVYLHSFLQSRQTAKIVKQNRRFLIHNVRLPLRRDK